MELAKHLQEAPQASPRLAERRPEEAEAWVSSAMVEHRDVLPHQTDWPQQAKEHLSTEDQPAADRTLTAEPRRTHQGPSSRLEPAAEWV